MSTENELEQQDAGTEQSEALSTEQTQTETTTTEETTEESTGEQAAASTEEKPVKKLGGFQKKLAKKDQELNLAKQEIEHWRSKALGSTAETKPVQTEVDVKKPVMDEFDNQADYFEALSDYKLKVYQADQAKKAKENEERTMAQKRADGFNSRLKTFVEKVPEYEDAIANFVEDHGDIKLSQALGELVEDSEFGPAIVYELAKNKAELDRLNSLNPYQVAKEIGKLEVKLTPKQEIKKTTTAPAPIKPIAQGQTKVVSLFDKNISQSQYEAMRMEQIKKAQARA